MQIVRSTAWLAAICIALGALWSGVEGGGVVFGALAGAFLFGTVEGVALLIAHLSGM
jgi:hypothetical protein